MSSVAHAKLSIPSFLFIRITTQNDGSALHRLLAGLLCACVYVRVGEWDLRFGKADNELRELKNFGDPTYTKGKVSVRVSVCACVCMCVCNTH